MVVESDLCCQVFPLLPTRRSPLLLGRRSRISATQLLLKRVKRRVIKRSAPALIRMSQIGFVARSEGAVMSSFPVSPSPSSSPSSSQCCSTAQPHCTLSPSKTGPISTPPVIGDERTGEDIIPSKDTDSSSQKSPRAPAPSASRSFSNTPGLMRAIVADGAVAGCIRHRKRKFSW